MRKMMILFLASMALLLFPAANAHPLTSVSGTFTVTGATTTESRMAGPNTIITQQVNFSLTGTFTGKAVENNAVTIARSSGAANGHATAVFTGSVGEKSGTLTFLVVTHGQGNSVSGSFTIISGTGDLASLHGHGTFQGTMGTGTYTGQMHFS